MLLSTKRALQTNSKNEHIVSLDSLIRDKGFKGQVPTKPKKSQLKLKPKDKKHIKSNKYYYVKQTPLRRPAKKQKYRMIMTRPIQIRSYHPKQPLCLSILCTIDKKWNKGLKTKNKTNRILYPFYVYSSPYTFNNLNKNQNQSTNKPTLTNSALWL